jgi:hypothetical protein
MKVRLNRSNRLSYTKRGYNGIYMCCYEGVCAHLGVSVYRRVSAASSSILSVVLRLQARTAPSRFSSSLFQGTALALSALNVKKVVSWLFRKRWAKRFRGRRRVRGRCAVGTFLIVEAKRPRLGGVLAQKIYPPQEGIGSARNFRLFGSLAPPKLGRLSAS